MEFYKQATVIPGRIIHGVESPGPAFLRHSRLQHYVRMEQRSSHWHPAPFCLLKAASVLYSNLFIRLQKVSALNISLLLNLFIFFISLGFVLFVLFCHCHFAA